jgi:hypothetical protein
MAFIIKCMYLYMFGKMVCVIVLRHGTDSRGSTWNIKSRKFWSSTNDNGCMDLAINSPSAKKKPFNFILEAEYGRLPNSYVAPIYIEISHSDIYLIKEDKL